MRFSRKMSPYGSSINTSGNFNWTRMVELPSVDFVFDQEIFSFQGVIDKHIDVLLSGAIDEGNANVLDNIINDVARRAVADIERQHASHINMILKLDASREGDLRESEHRIEDLRRELEETEELLDSLSRYRKTNAGGGHGKPVDLPRRAA